MKPKQIPAINVYEDTIKEIDKLISEIDKQATEIGNKPPPTYDTRPKDITEALERSIQIKFSMQENRISQALIRIEQTLIMMKMMGIVTKAVLRTFDNVPNKKYVDKIRKEHKEQKKRLEETLIPLNEEIRKTLQRQKRNEDLYR